MIQQHTLGVNGSRGFVLVNEISAGAPSLDLSTVTFNHLMMSTKPVSKKIHRQGDRYYYEPKIDENKKKMRALVTDEEYEKITHFDTIMITEALSNARRSKAMGEMLRIIRLLDGKNFLNLSRFDVTEMVGKLMQTYSDDGKETNTTYDTKIHLKIFLRWLKFNSRSFKDVGDVPEVADVKTRTVADKLVRENMLDDNDRANLISVAPTIQDKAIIALQYEAGLRPGELLDLQIKHIQKIKYGLTDGIKIAVDGKTGARPVILIESVSKISNWLTTHPFKDNLESPLWILTETQQVYGNKMTYGAINNRLQSIAKAAKIKKRINLKLFRHSSATRLATTLTDSIMRKRFGWSATSKMPSKYAHIVQSDVEDCILKYYGVEKATTVSRSPKTCPRCEHSVSFDDEICENCLKPLTIAKAEEMAQTEREGEDKRHQENFDKMMATYTKNQSKKEYDNEG